MSLYKTKNGQVFTLDIIVAITLFTTILVLAFFGWSYTQQKIYENEVRNEMEMVARNAAAALVLTPGEPASWNQTPVSQFNISMDLKSLGLSIGQPGVLSMQKIYKLEEVSKNASGYRAIKKFLGVNPYEIYIEFWDWDRNLSAWGCSCRYAVGALPPLNATEVTRINRVALAVDTNRTNITCSGRLKDGTYWTRVMVKVWKNETIG